MNAAIQTAIDHIKAKSDINGDGKVDKQDFDLVAKMVKADAQQFAGSVAGISTTLVAKATPFGAIAGGYAAGVATVLLYIRIFGG